MPSPEPETPASSEEEGAVRVLRNDLTKALIRLEDAMERFLRFVHDRAEAETFQRQLDDLEAVADGLTTDPVDDDDGR